MKNIFDVKWTGRSPNLCKGQWIIKKNGKDVTEILPEILLHTHMNTYGIYEEWDLDELGDGYTNFYEDGLIFSYWYKVNKTWVDKIADDMNDAMELYMLINNNDWRHNSCWGCL